MKKVSPNPPEARSPVLGSAPMPPVKDTTKYPDQQVNAKAVRAPIPLWLKSYCRAFLALALLSFLPTMAPAQCFVLQYPAYRRVLKVDGDFVVDYNAYKRLYKFEGNFLVAYSNYKRLLKFDGRYIVRYSDNRRIAYLDGEFLVRYSDNRRIAKLECPGQRSALAAAAYFLL